MLTYNGNNYNAVQIKHGSFPLQSVFQTVLPLMEGKMLEAENESHSQQSKPIRYKKMQFRAAKGLPASVIVPDNDPTFVGWLQANPICELDRQLAEVEIKTKDSLRVDVDGVECYVFSVAHASAFSVVTLVELPNEGVRAEKSQLRKRAAAEKQRLMQDLAF
jgi:hypothetical protein